MSTTRSHDSAFGDSDNVQLQSAVRSLSPCEIETVSRTASLLRRIHDQFDGKDLDPTQLTAEQADEILVFCRHRDISRDEAAQLTVPGSHEVKAKRGLWQSILLNLRNYEEGDPEAPRSTDIPIAEIHVPGTDGSTCAYTKDSSASAKIGLTVKIHGVGCGAGQEAKVTLSNTVTSPACGQVTIPATYQVTPWTNVDLGSRIDLVEFIDLAPDSIGLRDIPSERPHLCSTGVAKQLAALRRTPGSVFNTHSLGIAGSKETPSQHVESTRELALTIDGMLEMKSQFMHGFTYSWEIFGAANYLRFFESSRSHVHFWCWDT